jgi:hypothetical protein
MAHLARLDSTPPSANVKGCVKALLLFVPSSASKEWLVDKPPPFFFDVQTECICMIIPAAILSLHSQHRLFYLFHDPNLTFPP